MGTITLVTGTPGVGKSSLAKELSCTGAYRFVELNRLVKKERLYSRFDRKRRSYVVDEEKLHLRLEMISNSAKKTIIATHMVGRFLPKSRVERVFVLRLDPVILFRRLLARHWTRQKAWENTEAEILDISLLDSIELVGRRRVYEIDTTKKPLLKVYEEARMALSKPAISRVGLVNWLAVYDPVELKRQL